MLKQLFTIFIMFQTMVFISCDGVSNSSEKLSSPTLKSASGGNGNAVLEWTEVDGAETYNIYRDNKPGVTKKSKASKGFKSTKATIEGLNNEIEYYFKVAAVDSDDRISELSNEKKATPSGELLPPKKFKAEGLDSKVELSWQPSGGASSYVIFWDTEKGVTDKSEAIDDIINIKYTHKGLTNKTVYYYRIAAVDGAGNKSELSNEIKGTPKSENEEFVIKAIAGDEKVTIYGKDVPNAVKYNIYWDTKSGITTSSKHIVVENLSKGYAHEDLTNGTTYYYRANTEDASGNTTDLSKEVSATPDTGTVVSPKNVKVKAGAGQVVISWDQGDKDFNLIYWDTKTGVNEKSNTIGDKNNPAKSPHTHKELKSGTTYYYRVGVWVPSEYKMVLSDELSATPTK